LQETGEPASSKEARLSRRQRWLLGAGVVGVLLVAGQTRSAPPNAGYAGLAAIWLLDLGCVLVAAFPSGRLVVRPWRERLARFSGRARARWAVVGWILAAALLLRVVALDGATRARGSTPLLR